MYIQKLHHFCNTSSPDDVLPIFQQSDLIYKYQCHCNTTCIRHTSKRFEVRVKQHVPRDIRNHTTSGHSKLFDSVICEHLSALNSCVVNYSDECFVVLLRVRTKQHLIVLEAVYILFKWPSLCKQNPKHSLNLLGDIWWFKFFSPPHFCLAITFHFHSSFT